MLYEIKNVSISQGSNEILKNINFRMVDNEKVGIVGRNGAGKTTLLKFIMEEIPMDYNKDNSKGEVIKSNDFSAKYLRQQLVNDNGDGTKNENITAYDYLMSSFSNLKDIEDKINKLSLELSENYDEKKAIKLNDLIDELSRSGGDTYEKELKIGFSKFGFKKESLNKSLNEFSGGEATKIALLKLLLSKPEVLILDEPTNHLDIEAINWMENYLLKIKKNIIVVSHDRMFLDNICNVIYDVENSILTRYEGNYSDFVVQKEINYNLKMAEYNKNLKEIERLTALADRFRYKATKAKMVQSKDKIIAKIEEKNEKPLDFDNKKIKVKIIPKKQGGKEVLCCRNLVVGYEGKGIAKINCMVNRKDRLGIIGANGIGKSTFIKTIVGKLPPINGEFSYGHDIMFEYFDQMIAENKSTKKLFDDFQDEFPMLSNTEIRSRLGCFLFGEEDIDKRVCDLSGGEKVRLCLAKIFEKKPNLLILDEPTNHLDIMGKESLEDIIQTFEGTVILISHDRYFIKKISNKVLYFEKENNQTVTYMFDFGYEDYEKYLKSISKNTSNVADFGHFRTTL